MDDTLLRELFATPPPEFVAARNAAAKALRAEKRRDEATAVAALRRPGWDDWALNVVAAEHADVVGGFADAAGAVRDAQAAAIEGREGPDVRASLRELREGSAELIRLAGDVLGRVGRQSGSGEINARLSEIAASASAVEALRAGIVGSGGDGADDLFAGLKPAAHPAKQPAAKRTERAPRPSPPSSPAKADRAEDRAERKRRRDALAAATKEHGAATKALARADAAVAAAADATERAQRALAAAERDRDEAAETLAHADAAVEEAQAELDRLSVRRG